MLELTLVRHGETDYNRERRMQGHLDIPLNERGIAQLRKLAKRLRGQEFEMLYSSDLARAYRSAKICFPKREIILDKRLRERCYGSFEGKVYSDFSEEEIAIYRAYKQDPFKNRLSGGEDSYELFARINDWLQELPESGRVIVFTHGGVIRSLIRAVNGENCPIDPIENSSLNKFTMRQGVLQIVSLNDQSHLDD